MGAINFLRDRLTNVVSNLGTPRDKASASTYGVPLLPEDQAANMYRGSWLARKVIDIPALDATRRWRAWQAEQDQIERIEAVEQRLGYRQKIREAKIKADLFGGAAIYLGSTDADVTRPFNPAKGVTFMTVMPKRVLSVTQLETDPLDPRYGLPKAYGFADKPELKVHPSRFILFQGAPLPDTSLASQNGWGDSRLLAIREALMQSADTMANVASLVFEAKVDVVRIKNFMQKLATEKGYEQQLLNRFQLAATAKGINGMLLLDQDEEYETKSANFGTLPEIMDRFLQSVAGAADIPATRLLGQSPAGMNATGDSDIRNYYDRIQSIQELDLSPAMALADEAIIYAALGTRPPEIHYVWNSLWQVSATEKAANGKTAAETLKILAESKLFNAGALSQAGANLLVEQSVVPGLEAAIDDFGDNDEVGDPALENTDA